MGVGEEKQSNKGDRPGLAAQAKAIKEVQSKKGVWGRGGSMERVRILCNEWVNWELSEPLISLLLSSLPSET